MLFKWGTSVCAMQSGVRGVAAGAPAPRRGPAPAIGIPVPIMYVAETYGSYASWTMLTSTYMAPEGGTDADPLCRPSSCAPPAAPHDAAESMQGAPAQGVPVRAALPDAACAAAPLATGVPAAAAAAATALPGASAAAGLPLASPATSGTWQHGGQDAFMSRGPVAGTGSVELAASTSRAAPGQQDAAPHPRPAAVAMPAAAQAAAAAAAATPGGPHPVPGWPAVNAGRGAGGAGQGNQFAVQGPGGHSSGADAGHSLGGSTTPPPGLTGSAAALQGPGRGQGPGPMRLQQA